MVAPAARGLLLAGILLLAASCGGGSTQPPADDDASPFAAWTVADLIVNGTDAERRWGDDAWRRASDAERKRIDECIENLRREATDESAPPEAAPPAAVVSLRLRYLTASRDVLREIGVGLRGLVHDSPPYPTEAERRAGPAVLADRPDIEVLARLDRAIADGRLRVRASGESEGDAGALQTVSALEPASSGGGAVVRVAAYYEWPPQLGSLAIRRIAASCASGRPEDGALSLLGSTHVLDLSFGIRVVVRQGERLLLSPRRVVSGRRPDDEIPVLELTCLVRPKLAR